jgi:hypothetical protein
LIFLFYEDLDYSLGVREFLDAYYNQGSDSLHSRIEGRCGYIRQSFIYDMTDYDFNKISLYPDGLNAQSADIDFYDAT